MKMHQGLHTFLLVWFGETISLLGSSLTSFALGVWAYQNSGSVTQFALIGLFAALPAMMLSPIAGALIDRFDRRKVMIWADIGAGLSTLAVVSLFSTGRLEVWHLYITTGVASICGAFQMPAFTAASSLLVSAEQYGRTSGLRQLGMAIAQLVSPLLAGLLMVTIGLQGIIAIDMVTFAVAVGTLLFLRFPHPQESAEGRASRGSLMSEAAFGGSYITARPGLLSMLVLFAATNFAFSIVSTLFTPLLLTLTTPDRLGIVMTIGGLGMLGGSLAASMWAGPKRRIVIVLAGQITAGAAFIIGGGTTSLTWITSAAFVTFFVVPMINGSSEAIWQTRIPVDIQGRVFAMRSTIAISMSPLAYLLAGPLADHVFEPLMAPGGALAGSLGAWIGIGPGRGIGLLFIVMGALAIGATLVGWSYRPLVQVEDDTRAAETTGADLVLAGD